MVLFRCSNDTPHPSAFHVMTRRSLSLWFTSSNQEIGTINWPWADTHRNVISYLRSPPKIYLPNHLLHSLHCARVCFYVWMTSWIRWIARCHADFNCSGTAKKHKSAPITVKEKRYIYIIAHIKQSNTLLYFVHITHRRKEKDNHWFYAIYSFLIRLFHAWYYVRGLRVTTAGTEMIQACISKRQSEQNQSTATSRPNGATTRNCLQPGSQIPCQATAVYSQPAHKLEC